MNEISIMFEIAPSILSANFVRLEDEIRKVEDHIKILHIDVMDGHFVPNLTFGPLVIKSIRKITNLELDVHLMVSNPDEVIQWFIDAGSDNITLHYESADEDILKNLIHLIHKHKKSAGISISPKTPAKVLEKLLPHVDRVLCMTVEPGFGGQSFHSDMLEKIRTLAEMIQKINPDVSLEVDGGINKETAPLVVKAGATILVVGSAIFSAADPALALLEICTSIKNII